MEVLGRYELRRELGSGGFSTVYEAWDPSLERSVALKVLASPLAADRDIARRFVAEARALARLRHPNIVTVYDVGEAADRAFFTMELVNGYTVAQLIARSGPFDLPAAASILSQIANAIDYLHQEGFVHRDVKSANVMVQSDGLAMLMDFGIAKGFDDTQQTRAGDIIGTPTAMAPEQARGQSIGSPADIYAFGILAYEMLAGRPPFIGSSFQVIWAHVNEPPPPLETLRPGLPLSVRAAIEAALAKRPEDRPSTASEMAAALAGGKTSILPVVGMLAPPAETPTRQWPTLQTEMTGVIPEQLSPGDAHAPPTDDDPRPRRSDAKPDSPNGGASRTRRRKPQPSLDVEMSQMTPRPRAGRRPAGATFIEREAPPSGFFAPNVFPQSGFFTGAADRYAKIQETLQFYRDHLSLEYENLNQQAKTTYRLWVFCMSAGFVILLFGIILVFIGQVANGIITSASTTLLFFIQRTFQQREDHYRAEAKLKNKHLEYGNHWLLVIQSIDAIENATARAQQQTRLVNILTDKLRRSER